MSASWWSAAWTRGAVSRLTEPLALPVSGAEFCALVGAGIVRPADPQATLAACAAGAMGDSRITLAAGSVHIQGSRRHLGREVVADVYSVGDPSKVAAGQFVIVVSPQPRNPLADPKGAGNLRWQRVVGREVPVPAPKPSRAGWIAAVLLLAVGALVWRHTSGQS